MIRLALFMGGEVAVILGFGRVLKRHLGKTGREVYRILSGWWP